MLEHFLQSMIEGLYRLLYAIKSDYPNEYISFKYN